MELGQSPPAMKLRDALRWGDRLYQAVGGEEVHRERVLQAWGLDAREDHRKYTRLLKELGKYGLIERLGRGDGHRVRLTGVGKDIFSPESRASKEGLQKAALSPYLHGEIWKRGRGLDYQHLKGLIKGIIHHEMGSKRDLESRSIDRAVDIYRDALAVAHMRANGPTESPAESPAVEPPEESPAVESPAKPPAEPPKSEGFAGQAGVTYGRPIDTLLKDLQTLRSERERVVKAIGETEAALDRLGYGK